MDTHPVDSAGWSDLVATFQSTNLPIPPVPVSLRDDVAAIERWNWGTQPVSRGEMYNLAPSLVERLVALPEPCFAVSHGGHGVNSYAVTYLLTYRRLVLVMQVGWGGVYMDTAVQTAVMSDLFRGCAKLVEAEEQGGPDDGRRLVCLETDLRGYAECGWVDPSRYERHVVDPGSALTIAGQALGLSQT